MGLTERQLYNRTRAPTFREKLAEAKTALLERATNAAESRLSTAVSVMAEIMEDNETAAGTRVAAADGLIRNTLKLLELTDVSRRLDEIEKMLAEAETNGN
ncbi:MAG: hypothetical protein E7422_04630 [Ruminococcaceae bacterium]|nr:hypothetical protein [Oscillospiraceae bacterium]